MDLLQAIILATVEGITEFLPISSTGHLILTANILQITQTDFTKSFEIFIQLGAICAVVVLYWKILLTSRQVLQKVFIAFLPTAIVGFTLYRMIKDLLLGNTTITLLALFVGGIALILLELMYKEKEYHASSLSEITNKQALLIGIFQSISIIPGVSRAAATIIGGLFVGAKRKTATEFSFLLAVPTMLAASGFDLLKSSFAFSSSEYMILAIGFVVSFLVALAAIKFLLSFIKTHTFIPFGIYRIILALLFFLFVKS